MEIVMRRARQPDRENVITVESKSTPNLSYVPHVWDLFVNDTVGEFSVAEMDGELVGCAKFTVVPDGSAWLETLRVVPERQGLGVGKRFYMRFFDNARKLGVTTMRMYTGVKNVRSKGLAERFGFKLAEKFRGAWLPCTPNVSMAPSPVFRQVTDPELAASLVMPHSDEWGGFLVMNRTFYKISPELCGDLASRGMVYTEPKSGSVVVLGARFMPKQALHVGLFAGDAKACIEFAAKQCASRGAERLYCLFPLSAAETQDTLTSSGFQLEPSDFLVMEVHTEDK